MSSLMKHFICLPLGVISCTFFPLGQPPFHVKRKESKKEKEVVCLFVVTVTRVKTERFTRPWDTLCRLPSLLINTANISHKPQ